MTLQYELELFVLAVLPCQVVGKFVMFLGSTVRIDLFSISGEPRFQPSRIRFCFCIKM